MGLVNNPKDITYGRIVLQDPAQGITSMVYRNLAIQIFNKLTDYCLNDAVMYNRLRQLLSQDSPMKKEAFDNLVEKAEKSGIDLLTVIEVYNEGFEQEYPLHLTKEQKAFNRVNAYIADHVEVDPHKREDGTTELTNLYKSQTPGQSRLQRIKKALKK